MKSKKEMDAKAKDLLDAIQRKPQHALPWKVKKAVTLEGWSDHWTIETADGKNTPVSAIMNEANAVFIARAVNAHYELLNAIKGLANNELVRELEVIPGRNIGEILDHLISEVEGH